MRLILFAFVCRHGRVIGSMSRVSSVILLLCHFSISYISAMSCAVKVGLMSLFS